MDTVPKVIKNDKRTVNAWAIFDWANSAYALVISTAIFPIYFIAYTPDTIQLLGMEFTNSSLYSFSVAFSYLIIAFLSPLLSGMADYSGRRMFFLKLFTIIGSISCISLYFFKGEPQLWLGTAAFILATIGFSGGIVFYNSYLPIIVTEDRLDQVSAKGFAYGYIGSVILLIIILAMVLKPELFGIVNEQMATRIGFVLVGLWWFGFAQITFNRLPKDQRITGVTSLWSKGYGEIKKVYQRLKDRTHLKRFLWAFFFYFAGVQTIVYVATVFAEKELNFESTEMIAIVLVLQLVAIGGAYLFAYISKISSNKTSLISMILIWILICFGAYLCEGKAFFYILSAMVGLVLGGIQSMSRSTYSKMIDENEEDVTSFFSFYDVLYKCSLVVGSFSFGLVDFITGNIRNSVLVLMLYFLIGLWLLARTKLSGSKAV